MNTRWTTTHDIRRSLIAASVALAVVITVGVTSVSAAPPTTCRVRNTDSGKIYTALQAAVDEASPSDRLIVRGVCHGSTVIDRKLVISGVITSRTGKPILDGDASGTVLTVSRAEVLIEDLTIEDGSAPRWTAAKVRRSGGGISNWYGTLTLRDVAVRRSRGLYGGGVLNSGTLVLEGASRIVGNRSWIGYAGVLNRGALTMTGTSRISRNMGVGITSASGGSITMNGRSAVSVNGRDGVVNYGTLTLNDASRISANATSGVDNYHDGTLTLNDTSEPS